MLVYLDRIRRLAAGRARLTEPAPASVAQDDIDAALICAQNIEGDVKALEFSSDEHGVIGVPLADVRSRGRGGLMAELHYGAALSAASSLRRLLERRAGKPAGDVAPVPLEDIVRFDSPIRSASEILMVLTAEMAWEQTTYAAMTIGFNQRVDDLADMTLSLLPVVGPMYDIGSGIVGHRLPDGQRLTHTERTLRIGFAGVGVALGLVAKGVRVTGTTLKVIKAGRALNLPEHENQGFVALAMAVARLGPKQAGELAAIIKAVDTGARLTEEQSMQLARLFQIVNEYGIAAHWTRLGERPSRIAEHIGSAIVLKPAALKEGEREAIDVLCRGLGNPDVLVLPPVRPQEYARGVLTQVEKLKYPDLKIGSTLADIYMPRTSNLDKVFQEVASKSSQAATVVLNLDRTAVPAAEVVAQLPRLWGKPSAWGIYRVILLNTKGYFRSFARPLRFQAVYDPLPSVAVAVLRAALMKEWDAIEAADAQPSGR